MSFQHRRAVNEGRSNCVSAVPLPGRPVGTQWELRDLSGVGGGKGENKSIGGGARLVSDGEGTDERCLEGESFRVYNVVS